MIRVGGKYVRTADLPLDDEYLAVLPVCLSLALEV